MGMGNPEQKCEHCDAVLVLYGGDEDDMREAMADHVHRKHKDFFKKWNVDLLIRFRGIRGPHERRSDGDCQRHRVRRGRPVGQVCDGRP
jgi:hypothetical protein